VAAPFCPNPPISQAMIDELLRLAVDRLACLAPTLSILIPEPDSVDTAMASVSPTGWCEIGRLRDARNRFWYRVLWHPESGSGRLLRERPRRRLGPLGEALPTPNLEAEPASWE
jgi:transposase InsO family protein